MQISAITEKCIAIYSSVSITYHGKKGAYTHVLRVSEDSKTIFWETWCVSEKIVCELVPPITEKLISPHMSLKRPVTFLVDEITFKVTVITSSVANITFVVSKWPKSPLVVAKIIFKEAVIISSVATITFVVAKITFAVTETTFKVATMISSVAKIIFVVAEITFLVANVSLLAANITFLVPEIIVKEALLFFQWPRSLYSG